MPLFWLRFAFVALLAAAVTGSLVTGAGQAVAAAGGKKAARGKKKFQRKKGTSRRRKRLRKSRRGKKQKRLRKDQRRNGVALRKRQSGRQARKDVGGRATLKKRRRITEARLRQSGVDPRLARFVTGFYARLDELALLENVVRDGGLVRDGQEHATNYATHGLSHVADVVENVRPVLSSLTRSGTIRKRSGERREFVEALALQLSALHDIGNAVDGFSPQAREEHRQFAAQVVMTEDFDHVVRAVRKGPIGAYLVKNTHLLEGEPLEHVVREMLAGAVLHDKVTPEKLKSPDALASHMQDSLSTPLALARELGKPSARRAARNPRYRWLQNRQLFEDFRDAAALVVTMSDAFRMRGNRLHDSSGAQMAVHRRTGHVIHYKVDRQGRRHPAMVSTSPYARGDASIRSARFRGDKLAIALHDPPMSDVNRAAMDAAFQVGEILDDTIGRMVDLHGAPKTPVVLRPSSSKAGRVFAHKVMAALPARYRAHVTVGRPVKMRRSQRKAREKQMRLYAQGTRLPKAQADAVLQSMRDGGLPIVLRGGRSKALRHGLSRARRVAVKSGTRVFSRGDLVDYVFVVERGSAVLVDGAGERTRLGEGAILGQVAATSINTSGSHADIRVESTDGVSLIAIPREDYQRVFADYYHDVESLEASVR